MVRHFNILSYVRKVTSVLVPGRTPPSTTGSDGPVHHLSEVQTFPEGTLKGPGSKEVQSNNFLLYLVDFFVQTIKRTYKILLTILRLKVTFVTSRTLVNFR